MGKQAAVNGDNGRDSELAVDRRVRFNPGADDEDHGVVVEDFGEMPAVAVDIGGHHFADPARRWAVLLDSGSLVFADTDQLVAD